MNQISQQTTIKDFRLRHSLTIREIADMAGVPSRVVYQLEIGCPVNRDDAIKVQQTLYLLTGKTLSLRVGEQ